jgi:phosphoenolpyruvate synthase/pyruvate phosphate dikinase
LNLKNIDEVREAIRECRKSMNAVSVIEYCRKNGIDHTAMQMDVIVQRMIAPELAGVAFTIKAAQAIDERGHSTCCRR